MKFISLFRVLYTLHVYVFDQCLNTLCIFNVHFFSMLDIKAASSTGDASCHSSPDEAKNFVSNPANRTNNEATRTTPSDAAESDQDISPVSKDRSPSATLADSWEDAVDTGKLGSPFKTAKEDVMTNDRDEDDDEEREDVLPELEKSKTRRRANAEPVNKVKKEPVNLVIIGHVGGFLQIITTLQV